MSTLFLRLSVLSAAAAVLLSCSSPPERDPAIEQARLQLQTVRGDGQTVRLAPAEWQRATDALARAERARIDGEPLANIEHLAYISRQRTTIAQETASAKAAQLVTDGAAKQRDQMLLAQRTREADGATLALQQSQQDAARQAAMQADADALAQRKQQRSEARVDNLESQLRELNARATERGMVLTIGDLLFDSGKAVLLPQGRQDLQKLATLMREHPARRALIEGFTDSQGSAASNLLLSQTRAQSVMQTLMDLGVAGERMSLQAHGEEQPAATNDSAAGRQLNRRVEILFPPAAMGSPMR